MPFASMYTVAVYHCYIASCVSHCAHFLFPFPSHAEFVEQHHSLPSDDWESDTDYEEKPLTYCKYP